MHRSVSTPGSGNNNGHREAPIAMSNMAQSRAAARSLRPTHSQSSLRGNNSSNSNTSNARWKRLRDLQQPRSVSPSRSVSGSSTVLFDSEGESADAQETERLISGDSSAGGLEEPHNNAAEVLRGEGDQDGRFDEGWQVDSDDRKPAEALGPNTGNSHQRSKRRSSRLSGFSWDLRKWLLPGPKPGKSRTIPFHAFGAAAYCA